jgi:hypothetical protein
MAKNTYRDVLECIDELIDKYKTNTKGTDCPLCRHPMRCNEEKHISTNYTCPNQAFIGLQHRCAYPCITRAFYYKLSYCDRGEYDNNVAFWTAVSNEIKSKFDLDAPYRYGSIKSIVLKCAKPYKR